MKIACIGWGSLCWDAGSLEIDGDWKTDGPILPVEFTRISENNRVTLIIDEQSSHIETLWSLMTTEELADAKESLKEREGTPNMANIHSVTTSSTSKTNTEELVQQWLFKKELDAAIWTGLSYSKKTNFKRPSIEEILIHLQSLTGEKRDNARKYVINAPKQINTEYRKKIEDVMGWKPEESQQ